MAPPPSDRRDRLTAMFAGELTDRTRTLEDGLLALERSDLDQDQRIELLDELARAAHTLKGSAGMMGAATVAARCHDLEDALGRLRTRDRIDADVLTALLEDVDRIRHAGAEHTGEGADVQSEEQARSDEAQRPTAARREGPAGAGARQAATAAGSIRLPTDRLDTLVGRAAELRTATTSLVAVADQLAAAQRDLHARRGAATDGRDATEAWRTAAALVGDVDRRVRPLLRSIERAATGVDTAVRDAATVPVLEACAGLQRTVRDIADSRDKQLRLRLSVGEAEIDRRAVGVIRDALVHLVRNAADHGIEPSAQRRAAGKPPEGTIEVAATVQGDRVVVTVRDDGRGVDAAGVTAAARARGIPTEADAHDLVFTAGLSTAAATTDISGRGVGLDAVRAQVESLRGTVTMASEPGDGTTVTLTVPASLATARVLLVEVAGEQVALLTHGIERLIRVRHAEVVVSDDRSWVRYDERMLALLSLTELAGFGTGSSIHTGDRASSPAVVVAGTAAGGTTSLLVDRVTGEQELLVQPVGGLLEGLPGVVGAGMLARGRVVLLLHPAALIRSGRQRATVALGGAGYDRARRRVLLAEDSATTRALEQGLLEAAGYDVVPAVDGRDAWELLRREAVDVVVSDIEMPNLDGIALCERVRSAPTLRELPIVLVTSRDSDEDRRRGAEAGADAYLVKSSFAQGDLIATIERMLT